MKVAGVDPVYAAMRESEFNGSEVDGVIVQKTGPNAPLPPGVDRLPNVGEILLSPALQQLLNSPAGELLRPRFPERVIGTVSEAGLTGPHELFFYVGVAKVAGQSGAAEVYQFGRPSEPRTLDGLLWLLIALGSSLGGYLGARIGRRLPASGLRAVIFCIGVAAIVKLVYG